MHGVHTQQRQSDKYSVTPTYKSTSFPWGTVYPGARNITYIPSTTIRPYDFYGNWNLEYMLWFSNHPWPILKHFASGVETLVVPLLLATNGKRVTIREVAQLLASELASS
jgi:hypothetical protein